MIKSKEQIVSEMCLTSNHSYGLPFIYGTMTNDEKDALRRDMEQLYHHHIQELKIGHDRYEKIRKLNPKQFLDLWTKCLMTNAKFDEEVDKL
jgi:hypothetical protein